MRGRRLSILESAFVAVLLACMSGVASAQLTVRASVNPPRAQVGEWLGLVIEISGSQSGGTPEIEQIPGFDARYLGPSTQVSIVNGQMNASVQHRYQIMAQSPGRYTLGPFTVKHSGKQYVTEPVTVEILPAGSGAAAPGPAGSQLRLTLSAARDEVYLRERITVDVALYVGQVRVGDLQYPTIAGEGFAMERVGEPTQRQEVIDGQTYQVVRFQSLLTPLSTGTLNIGPATLQLSQYERRRGGIFDDPFFSDRRPITLRADTIALTVLPLPEEDRPDTFSGAVGQYELREVTAAPTELSVGDPITLRMTIAGRGNLADLHPPALTSTQGLKTYEARPSGGTEDARFFEQVLIPNDVGVAAVPPVRFSYFDPTLRQYRTLESAPIPLVVRPAQQAQEPAIISGGIRQPAPEELGRDIVYIKDTPGSLSERGSGMGVLFWLWQPIPLALAAAAFLYDRRRTRLRGDVRYARFTRAGKAAERGMREASAALERQDRPAFYDTLAATLRDYLAAKLDLPPGSVDLESIARRGVPEDIATQIHAIFAACEQARFAPSASDGDMRGVLQQVESVVRRLERERRAARALAAALTVLLVCGVASIAPVAGASTAGSPQTTFFRANTLYGEGKFAEAVGSYEEILSTGVESGALYFNLGNAYFKLGRHGQAILSYERALRVLPGDPDVQANLNYARSLTGAEPCTAPVWQSLLFPLATRVTPRGLGWLISAVYSVALVAFGLARLFPQNRRWLSQLAAALGAGAVIALASAAYRAVALDTGRQAVLTAPAEVAARFQPTDTGTEHFTLKPGTPVRLVDWRESWAEIERCDGRRGWLPLSTLGVLRDDGAGLPERGKPEE